MNKKNYTSPEVEIEKFSVSYSYTVSQGGGLDGGDTDVTVPDDEF